MCIRNRFMSDSMSAYFNETVVDVCLFCRRNEDDLVGSVLVECGADEIGDLLVFPVSLATTFRNSDLERGLEVFICEKMEPRGMKESIETSRHA